MIFQLFEYQELAIQSYLVGDPQTKECFIIDPPRDTHAIQRYLKKHGLLLKGILETHVHADFISGAKELKTALHNHPLIYASAAGGKQWLAQYADCPVQNGDCLTFGDLRLQALHTPGHTPEHMSWLLFSPKTASKPLCAFTGDFLLVNSVGRPDLLGASFQNALLKELHFSLFTRLASLPNALEVYPGHGPGSFCGKAIGSQKASTLGDERTHNPHYSPETLPVWSAHLLKDLPPSPKLFSRNKALNVHGTFLLKDLPKDCDSPSPAALKKLLLKGCIFDFRTPSLFVKKHLRGAVNVPLGTAMGNWLTLLLPLKTPILCVLPNRAVKRRVAQLIRTLGGNQPLFFMTWRELKSLPLPFESLKSLTPQTLYARKELPFILDVRTPSEWNQERLSHAHHKPLYALCRSLPRLAKERPIVVVCRRGTRSSVAASLLQAKGFTAVAHLAGGLSAWKTAHLPTLKGEDHAKHSRKKSPARRRSP